jgi:F-box-like
LSDSTQSRDRKRSELKRIYSDPLPDDVLFKIFEYLDALDLINCEMVCHIWRDVLSRQIIWKKPLDREVSDGFPFATHLTILPFKTEIKRGFVAKGQEDLGAGR